MLLTLEPRASVCSCPVEGRMPPENEKAESARDRLVDVRSGCATQTKFAAGVMSALTTAFVVGRWPQHYFMLVVAKSLIMRPDAGSVQLHARCFQGAFVCAHSHVARCSDSARSCSDRLRTRRCQRKLLKGKCGKRRMRSKCALTCGQC